MSVKKVVTTICILLLSTQFMARAHASANDAARLQQDLTPMGAERDGNAEGTIPAWQPHPLEIPKAYHQGDHHPDPFAAETPLYRVDHTNIDKFGAQLTEAHRAMLQRYPEFGLQVFPSHRTATYPERIYKAVAQNAVHAKLVQGGEGVINASGGSPFPIPNDAYEVMWNHKLRYRGEAVETFAGSAVVDAKGQFTMTKVDATLKFIFSDPDRELNTRDNTAFMLLGATTAPAKIAGNKLLVHEFIDSLQEPRKSWLFLSGQRRVRRAPDIGYDAPVLMSDSLAVVDNTDMFSGAMDRFDWKLLGKQEKLIPYNAYPLHSAEQQYDNILKPRHLNPDVLRYELHRVWVVEATVKKGLRHRYAKRVFYLDEDSWQVAVVEQYDGKGNLVSVAEGHPINYYEKPVFWYTLEVVYNLDNQHYYATGLDNQEKMYDFSIDPKLSYFTPANLARLR